MILNPALLGELEKLDPELYQDIYETGFRTCSWPNYLVMGKVLEALDRLEIPTQISNEPIIFYGKQMPDSRKYSIYGRANDVTKSDYMADGDSWAEAVLKLYLQILRRHEIR